MNGDKKTILFFSIGAFLNDLGYYLIFTIWPVFVTSIIGAPVGVRASVIGSFQMLVGLTALPASLIAGILWDSVSFKAPFVFSLCLTTVAFFLLFFIHNPKES